jgi:DNA-binding MarR family transcriptional regulator
MRTRHPEPKYFIGTQVSLTARHLMAYYNRELVPYGLTAQQLMALGVLWREGEISLGVFAKKLEIGKAAAVSMIKRLEALGFAARKPHPKDARLNSIELTDKALKLAPEAIEKAYKLEKTIESAIGSSNLQTLIKGLSIIRDLQL